MCGIIGMMQRESEVFSEIYDGLLMLQHRGQDAAGIVTFDGRHFHEQKNSGLVRDVFSEKKAQNLRGKIGIGHVRYPTSGSTLAKEAQPFFVNAPFGMYLVHNGNITNAPELRERLQQKCRRHLRTDSDSEVLLNIFADQVFKKLKNTPKDSVENIIFGAAAQTMSLVRGAYSVICIIDEVGIFAFRDRAGIRPLSLGTRPSKLGQEWAVASEDIAFKSAGFTKVRDIRPGEGILIADPQKKFSSNGAPKNAEFLEKDVQSRICAPGELSPCIFEYVYLARPDSMMDNISVYKTQIRLGQKLAQKVKSANLKIDTIMPVPDSSRPVAIEMAQILGIKYREGLVKNRYIGRTFIMPGAHSRKKSVKQKLNAIGLEFQGRSILLVDDSIVRGTTMRQIVQMCREMGAKKIFVASAAPQIKNICVYGVDMPTKKELIAPGLRIDEIQKMLNIDGLFFQNLSDLIDSASQGNRKIKHFCTGCFGGKYPTKEVTKPFLEAAENSARAKQKNEEMHLLNF